MKIAVMARDPRRLESLRQMLAETGREVVLVEGDVAKLPAVADSGHLQLLLLDGIGESPDELALIERVLVAHPQLPVVMLSADLSAERLMEAMRVGVREVLPATADQHALRELIARIQRRGAPGAEHGSGKVLAFIPCKGGSGATFLAANLAFALAREGKRVALFDLNLQFGDALLFVSERAPTATVADLARDAERVDAALLRSGMVPVLPNFDVLAAPEEPEKSVEVRPEAVDRLIALAARDYDFVVLDLDRQIDTLAVKAMDRADEIYAVLQMTLPFLRDAKRLLGVFESLGYGKTKLRLMVNRFERGGEISLADVEKTLGQEVRCTVPNSFKAVAASVNQGMPILLLAPRDPVARCLRDLAHEMVHGRRGGGWLREMFHLD